MRKQKPFSSALRKSEIRGRKHHDLWLINAIMRVALFCRDKGRCRVDVGALCLSPSCGGDLLASQHTDESDCHEGQAQGPHPSQRPPLVPTEQGRAYVIQSTTGVVEPYGRICIKQDQGGNVEARYRFDLRSDPLSMCDIWPEGDRKGPHPSASSTPASTKNEPGEPLRSHSRGGGRVEKGGDPCGRLSCFSTTPARAC